MPDPKTLEAVAVRAAAIADLREKLAKEIMAIRQDLRAADRDGHGRNEIARKAEGGLSRKLVFEALGASDLTARAEAALRDAGLDGTQFLLRPDPRPAIALGSEVGEDEGGGRERLHVAQRIADVLSKAGIVVDDVDRLADWEFTTLSISKEER